MKRASPNLDTSVKKMSIGHGQCPSSSTTGSKPMLGRGRGRGLLSFIPENRVESSRIKSLLDENLFAQVVNGEDFEIAHATKLSEIKIQDSPNKKT